MGSGVYFPPGCLQTVSGLVEHKPLASAWGAGSEGAGLTYWKSQAVRQGEGSPLGEGGEQ